MQLSVELEGRVLRYDGTSIICPEDVADALLHGVSPTQMRVTHLNEDIQAFNSNVVEEDTIRIFEEEPVKLNFSWNLPEKYKTLNLSEVVGKVLDERSEELYQRYTQQQWDSAFTRVIDELHEIETRGMTDFFRTVIYILDVFKERGVVWGVGRGSSCASYVLFLLNLHSVDPIIYDIPLDEFFHD